MSLLPLDVANADFVTDRLAVGGDLAASDPDLAVRQGNELREAGITHVVDARSEWNDEATWGEIGGVEYLWNGIDDLGQEVPDAWFEDVVVFALDALEDPDAKVLAHCHAGINRGPSAAFAILLGLGWEPRKALDTLIEARPEVYVAYAGDALRWHHERTGADQTTRERHRAALDQWREDHGLTSVEVAREMRS